MATTNWWNAVSTLNYNRRLERISHDAFRADIKCTVYTSVEHRAHARVLVVNHAIRNLMHNIHYAIMVCALQI